MKFQFNQNGTPVANGKLFTYSAGTTNKLATFTDSTGGTPNTNPIILDANGQCDIWLTTGSNYKFVLSPSTDTDPPTNAFWTEDNISSSTGSASLSANGPSNSGASLVGFDGGTVAGSFLSKVNRVVDSISVLRGISKAVYTRAFATGYYLPHDGGGGAYQFDPADTTSTDNGGTIIVASDGGRWKLQYTSNVSVKQFGAKGDGTTDDTASINAGLAAGIPLFFPLATYNCTAALTSTNQNVAISADPGAIVAFTSGATAGFTFTFNNIIQTLKMSDLTIQTSLVGIGSGVSATWPVSASSTFKTCQLTNLFITSPGNSNGYFQNGITLSYAWLGEIDNCTIRGQNNTVLMSTGIQLTNHSTDFKIRGCYVFFAGSGYQASSFSESPNISQCYAVYCNLGVDINNGSNAPGCFVSDCHFAVFQTGVNVNNQVQACIHGNLIYKRSDSTQSFIGIIFQNSGVKGRVYGNNVYGLGSSGTSTGISISADSISVFGNQFDQCGTSDINLTAAGTNSMIFGNTRVDGSNIAIVSGTASGFISRNFPLTLGYDQFALNQATPNVGGGTHDDYFLTNNSAGTTVTNFSGGYVGQTIHIQAGDGNTTLQNNANLFLKGATNVTLAVGNVIHLKLVNSTTWYEQGRSF